MGPDSKQYSEINPDGSINTDQFLRYAEDLAHLYGQEKIRRKELERAHKRLSIVFNSMSEGVIAAEADGTLYKANAAFCDMLGLEKDAVLGRKIEDVFPSFSCPRFGNREECSGECIQVLESDKGDRKNRHFRVTGSLLEGGEHIYVFSDVTLQVRTERLKATFLALLSHELRTPLNGAMGFMSLLRAAIEEKDSSNQLEYIGYVNKSLERMTSTVGALLRFVDVEDKQLEEPRVEMPLADILEKSIASMKPEIDRKRLKVSLEVPEMANVRCNQTMLGDAFQQLLGNASKYTRYAGAISVTATHDEENVTVTITDTGVGIPEGELEHVFESFYQVEDFMTRSQEGLGLGLTLAAHIIRTHDGDIRLESEVGKGTSVFVTLPIAHAC